MRNSKHIGELNVKMSLNCDAVKTVFNVFKRNKQEIGSLQLISIPIMFGVLKSSSTVFVRLNVASMTSGP